MTATLKSIEGSGDIAGVMGEIGRRAHAAARVLARTPAEEKNRALTEAHAQVTEALDHQTATKRLEGLMKQALSHPMSIAEDRVIELLKTTRE